MTPRDRDPAVWAAAYGAAFHDEYRTLLRTSNDPTPTVCAASADEYARDVADLAVRALHPKQLDGQQGPAVSYTPSEVINMTRRVANATWHMLTHALGWPQHESNGWDLDTIGGHPPDSSCWIRVMHTPPHVEPGWTIDRELGRFTRWLATLGYAIERLPSASIEPIFRLVPARVSAPLPEPEEPAARLVPLGDVRPGAIVTFLDGSRGVRLAANLPRGRVDVASLEAGTVDEHDAATVVSVALGHAPPPLEPAPSVCDPATSGKECKPPRLFVPGEIPRLAPHELGLLAPFLKGAPPYAWNPCDPARS